MSFLLTARDADMVEVAPIHGYLSLSMDLRLMGAEGAVGTGTVVVSNRHPALRSLLASDGNVIEGTGIVIRRAGTDYVVASGDIEDADIDGFTGGRASLVVRWDDGIFGDEIAYADPTTDVSSTGLTTLSDGHDIRTGVAEDVLLDYLAANIGPAAGVTRRRYPWLILPTSGGRGGSDTWKARDETLLDLARRICIPHGLAFRLAQNPTGAGVAMEVWEPGTTPAARFSPQSGGVTGLKLKVAARTVDEVIVLGPGTEVARVRTRRNTTLPAGRRRRVRVIDARQADGTGTEIRDLMRQPADEALTDGDTVAAATFTLVERTGAVYGVDWALGSVLSVADQNLTTVEAPVQSVRITHDAGRDPVIEPHIGTGSDLGAITGLKQLRRLINPLLTQ